MKRKLFYTILILISVVLIVRVLTQLSLEDVLTQLRDAHLGFLFLLFLSSIAAVLFRAMRWRLLLSTGADHVPSLFSCVQALFCGYFINIGLPRAGELFRCAILRTSQAVPISRSLGTVIVERASDLLMLLLILMLTLFLFMDRIGKVFIEKMWIPIYELGVGRSWTMPVLLVLAMLSGLTIMAILLFKRWKTIPLISRLRSIGLELVEGLSSVFRLGKLRFGLFSLLTIAIWLAYFFNTYLLFFSFPILNGLGLDEAFIVQSMGSLAKLVPVQAQGAGAYHYIVSETMIGLGHEAKQAAFLALVNHGFQLLVLFCLGGLSLLILILQYGSSILNMGQESD